MTRKEHLEALTKDELTELVQIYARNWLAMDGVWFQSVEKEHGMRNAMFHDEEAWRRFTVIEAKRIRTFLKLDEHPGLEGLAKALKYRFYGCLNDDSIQFVNENGAKKLIYTMIDCRVQSARKKKNMELHPCKSVGIIEYGGFAREIDERISCRCISCYPEITDDSCCCKWEFSLEE